MDYEDIRRARAHHAELSRIFSRTLSPDDAHLGPQVLRECWGAWTAVDNNQCRSRIRKIVECASQLFAPRPRGVPVILREQQLNEKIRLMLRYYAWWLDYLEAARAARSESDPARQRASRAA